MKSVSHKMSRDIKHPPLKDLRYRLEFAGAKMLAFITDLLSVEQALNLGAFLARIAFCLLARKRNTAISNLAMVFPEKTHAEHLQMAKKSFESNAMSMGELFMMKRIVETAAERFDLSETQNYDVAIAKKKGVILAISHLGAWECHELLAYFKKTPCVVIVKNLKNPYINREINRLRALTSVTPHDKDQALRAVFACIRQGGMAPILLDQWAGSDGVWIPFFGKETSTSPIAVRLAQKTGAIIVPSFCIRVKPGRYKIICLPEVTITGDEKETTQKLNDLLEQKIREYPEQWIWGHRRWKEKIRKNEKSF